MKSFSKSTITGLVLGILLAGYAVFAFQAPTQAPPGGNVPTPLNVGPSDQSKAGGTLNVFGLWVNQALGVSGGATIGGGLSVSGSLTSAGQSVCLSNGTNCLPSGVPVGFVGFFNLSSCPFGWSELTSAQGRYVVGKPSGGTLGATTGTALSDQENRPVGQHNHSVSDPGHSHGIDAYDSGEHPVVVFNQLAQGMVRTIFSPAKTTRSAGTGLTVNNTGSPGTNAPYIQFLVCQKN